MGRSEWNDRGDVAGEDRGAAHHQVGPVGSEAVLGVMVAKPDT